MGSGLSKNQAGDCGAPSGVDPRVFALVKIHKVPHKTKYLDMYSGYSRDHACKDIASWYEHKKPAVQITKFHKILRKGQFGQGAQNSRNYVLKKVYKLKPREMKNVGEYFTKNMATKEIHHQELRKSNPSMPKYRYQHSYGIRFTNTEKGFVYKEGRKGYTTGFTYAGGIPNLKHVDASPQNPKVYKNKSHHVSPHSPHSPIPTTPMRSAQRSAQVSASRAKSVSPSPIPTAPMRSSHQAVKLGAMVMAHTALQQHHKQKSGNKNLPPLGWSMPGPSGITTHAGSASKPSTPQKKNSKSSKSHFTKTNIPKSKPVVYQQKGITSSPLRSPQQKKIKTA
jgi:hypothetical protein